MQRTTLFISCLLIFCFISIWLVQNTFGQVKENGVIGQVVGNNKTQFYVSDVKKSNTSEFVEISIIFKNLANGPQEFSPSVRLIDTESREYEPKSGSGFSFSPVEIPPDDILAWKASFNVVTPSNISKIYFTILLPVDQSILLPVSQNPDLQLI